MNLMRWLFGPPSQDRFAAKLMELFRQAGYQGEFEYDKNAFVINFSEDHTMSLSNVYLEHCRMGRRDRPRHLAQLVETLMVTEQELPDSLDEARAHLRPKVWMRATFEEMELRQRLEGGKGLGLPLYALGEHLVTSVVYDQPSTIRSISNDDLEAWGLTYYEAMEIARGNLEQLPFQLATIGDGFYSVLGGDAYDAARILLKDKILEWDVDGDPVAMVLQRDSLYVTGSNDEAGLAVMVTLAEQETKDPLRPLSPIPLRLVDGEWEDWTFPASHPDSARHHQLVLQFLAGLYESQQSLLSAIHEKEGNDVFVASFSGIVEKATERLLSYCVWSKGCESILPETDLIMFNDSGNLHPCRWRDAARVVGRLMEPVEGVYPVRYRVASFPDPAQLAEIPRFEN